MLWRWKVCRRENRKWVSFSVAHTKQSSLGVTNFSRSMFLWYEWNTRIDTLSNLGLDVGSPWMFQASLSHSTSGHRTNKLKHNFPSVSFAFSWWQKAWKDLKSAVDCSELAMCVDRIPPSLQWTLEHNKFILNFSPSFFSLHLHFHPKHIRPINLQGVNSLARLRVPFFRGNFHREVCVCSALLWKQIQPSFLSRSPAMFSLTLTRHITAILSRSRNHRQLVNCSENVHSQTSSCKMEQTHEIAIFASFLHHISPQQMTKMCVTTTMETRVSLAKSTPNKIKREEINDLFITLRWFMSLSRMKHTKWRGRKELEYKRITSSSILNEAKMRGGRQGERRWNCTSERTAMREWKWMNEDFIAFALTFDIFEADGAVLLSSSHLDITVWLVSHNPIKTTHASSWRVDGSKLPDEWCGERGRFCSETF